MLPRAVVESASLEIWLGQPALDALARASWLYQMTSRGPFQHQSFCQLQFYEAIQRARISLKLLCNSFSTYEFIYLFEFLVP